MNKSSIISAWIAAIMLLPAAGCSSGGQLRVPDDTGDTASDPVAVSDASATEPPTGQMVIPEHHHEQTAKPVYDPDASCSNKKNPDLQMGHNSMESDVVT